MLVKLLPLVLALSVGSVANAQFAIDFNAGVGRSNMPFSVPNHLPFTTTLPKGDGYTGFSAGVAPSYGLGERFRALLTVQYSKRGYGAPPSPLGEGTNVRLGYIDFVPELEWRPIEFLGVSVGPYLGFNTSARSGDGFNLKNFDYVQPLDIGAVALARVYWRDFFALVRYAHGFANITELPYTDQNGALADGPLRQRMRNTQVGLGYRLSFPRG